MLNMKNASDLFLMVSETALKSQLQTLARGPMCEAEIELAMTLQEIDEELERRAAPAVQRFEDAEKWND